MLYLTRIPSLKCQLFLIYRTLRLFFPFPQLLDKKKQKQNKNKQAKPVKTHEVFFVVDQLPSPHHVVWLILWLTLQQSHVNDLF